jgi:hypothetical protein
MWFAEIWEADSRAKVRSIGRVWRLGFQGWLLLWEKLIKLNVLVREELGSMLE